MYFISWKCAHGLYLIIQRYKAVFICTCYPLASTVFWGMYKCNELTYPLAQVCNRYRITALFGACAYSQKNAFWELIENAGAPILYILRLTSVRLFSSRGAWAKKRNNTVTGVTESTWYETMCIEDSTGVMIFYSWWWDFTNFVNENCLNNHHQSYFFVTFYPVCVWKMLTGPASSLIFLQAYILKVIKWVC